MEGERKGGKERKQEREDRQRDRQEREDRQTDRQTRQTRQTMATVVDPGSLILVAIGVLEDALSARLVHLPLASVVVACVCVRGVCKEGGRGIWDVGCGAVCGMVLIYMDGVECACVRARASAPSSSPLFLSE